MRVLLKEVVLGFAKDLFTPTSIGDGPTRYRCTPMIDKGSENDKAIQAAIKAVAEEKWGKKAANVLENIRPIPQQFCYKDGDKREYEGSAGRMLLSATNADQPTLLDRRKAPAGKDLIYSGAICNVSVDIYAYDNTNKGIGCGVRGVQFVKHGDALAGGGVSNGDEFGKMDGDDDEGDATGDFD